MYFIIVASCIGFSYISYVKAYSHSPLKDGRGTHLPKAIFPVSSPTCLPSFPFHGTRPLKPVPTGPLNTTVPFDLSAYPSRWKTPDIQHHEVQNAIRSINWNYVPQVPLHFRPRVPYDLQKDDGCWWTNKLCSTPKVRYLPDDILYCTRPNDFGLTFDDGPLTADAPANAYNEPYLYDFLASQNQTATLFFIGSSVASFPDAALRALQSGHTLCAHTWSHTYMTSLHNEQVVAELYWTIRAIKEATGVTTRCWRPSYGDVDDRVRAIAHQLGLRTIVWNSDSLDWGIPSVSNNFTEVFTKPEIDMMFQNWIDLYRSGNQTHGRVVLEHENTVQTIQVAREWVPRLKEVFNVKKVHECVVGIGHPYWES